MLKVKGGPIDPPPPLKASCNYFFFEDSRVKITLYCPDVSIEHNFTYTLEDTLRVIRETNSAPLRLFLFTAEQKS